MPNSFKILQCVMVLQSGHESMHTITETASVTLTFDIRAWFFSRHVDLIWQTLVLNYFKIILCIRQLQTGYEWLHFYIYTAAYVTLTLKIEDRGVVHSPDTSSWYAKHVCQVIWKSMQYKYMARTQKLGRTDRWTVWF